MKNGATVLTVTDDMHIIRFITANLMARGFTIIATQSEDEVIRTLEHTFPDLVIIDNSMAIVDGMDLFDKIRGFTDLPAIILTTRDYPIDDLALNVDTDCCITKPFGVEDLLNRIHTALRQKKLGNDKKKSVFVNNNLRIDFTERRVTINGSEVILSRKEYALLRELAQNSRKVLTHEALLTRVWGPEYINEKEYLRVYIGKLRNKIEANSKRPTHILTISGIGYTLRKHT